jgi:YggT family protein
MNHDYVGNAAVYLISTIFTLYLTLVMLRFLLQLVRADFHNPLSQFVVKATNPPLRLLRRIIPGLGGIDLAAIVLMFALQMLMIWLIHVANAQHINISGMLLMALAELTSLMLNVLLVAIIAQVILSWVGPQGYNPIISLIYSLTEPVLRPARRVLPPISGLDLSPLLVFLAMQLIKILVIAPIADLGRSLGYT